MELARSAGVREARHRRASRQSCRAPAPPVGAGVSPLLALLTLVVLGVLVLLAELLARRIEAHFGGGPHELTRWDIASAVVEHILIVAAALIPARLLLGGIRWPAFGFRPVALRPAITSAAEVYGGYLVLAALLFALIGAPPARESASALAIADSPSLLIAYAFMACVVAPPTEELLFRGFLFGALRGRLQVAPAALAAGALFGAAHGPPLGTMLDLALLGIALCVLYERTGSLLPCIAVHAVHNSFAFGAIASPSPPATAGLAITATLAAVAVSLLTMHTSPAGGRFEGGGEGSSKQTAGLSPHGLP